MRGRIGVLVVGVLAVLAGCGGSSGQADATGSSTTEAPTVTTAPEDETVTTALEVEVVESTFVDTSRPTDAGAETPARPG